MIHRNSLKSVYFPKFTNNGTPLSCWTIFEINESPYVATTQGIIPIEKDNWEKETFEITDYDIIILKYLSEGLDQKDICKKLKIKGIKPYSISSVEKRLKLLKENFNANNPTQLIAITKDFGLI